MVMGDRPSLVHKNKQKLLQELKYKSLYVGAVKNTKAYM